MKGPPPLPDLTRLTEAQKDELIAGLWETLRAIESATDVFHQPVIAKSNAQDVESSGSRTSTNELHERIAASAPSRRGQSNSPVAYRRRAGFQFLTSTPLLVTIALIGLGFLADFGIGWYQRRLIEARERPISSFATPHYRDYMLSSSELPMNEMEGPTERHSRCKTRIRRHLFM